MKATLAVGLAGVVFGIQVAVPSLASPEMIAAEHAVILVLGAWGLVETIKQGKRIARLEGLLEKDR